MSIKVSMFFRHPTDHNAVIDFDPDTLIQTIEAYLDNMAAAIHEEEGMNAYRELLIRVENVDE